MTFRSILFALVAAPLLLAASSLSAQTGSLAGMIGALPYVEAVQSITNLAPDPTKVATIEQLMLTRDVGTIVLEQGKLYLCKPVSGRLYAAVFVGKGAFQYTPPIWVEQDQLERYTNQRQMYEEFSSLVFFCADSTIPKLEQDWAFEPEKVPGEVTDRIEEALLYISDSKAGYVDPDFLTPLLNEDFSSLFYAHFSRAEKPPFFFMINPYDYTGEEIGFMLEGDRAGNMRYRRPVNQFHTQEEYAAGKVNPNDNKEALKVTHYNIETTLPKGKEFAAVADLTFTMQREREWVPFQVYPELYLDSAFWEDGTPAAAIDGSNGFFWVGLREGLKSPGESGRLRIHYHGDVIERREDWFLLKSSIQWYPHHGYKQKATFDLTFHVPKEFRFVSIGKKVSEKEQDGLVTTRWVTDSAVRNASFNLGYFDEHIVKADSLPPISIWMSRYGHAGVGLQQLADYGVTSGSNMEEQVADDIKTSITLFSKIFGKYQPERITVTEIPFTHGEAFPGLIHISWTTFQRTDGGWDHRFRAHEVAHQWWGASGVDFETYHDQWLSEGFADYSSLMYLGSISKDKDLFQKTLREWRGNIKKNANAGPIWMGWRLGNAYNFTVYEKGAWVLHMIRNMMLDLKTMKEDRFLDMMKDFFNTYRGREASTEDFQAMVEKHMDSTNMNWFFDQWVYGTAIPTYKFDYTVRKGEDGKHIVSVKVEQKNVPPSFQMYVPIKIDFGDNGISRLRVLISGSGGEFDLPPLPHKPEEIVFNDLESVLCEME